MRHLLGRHNNQTRYLEKMYEALLIRPDYLKRRRTISCAFCAIKYTRKDYETLLAAKKIAYFEFSSFSATKPIVCHDCLHKYICQLSDNPTAKILNIKDRDKILKCKVYCNEGAGLEDWHFDE